MSALPVWAAAFSSQEHAWATPQGVVDAIAELLGVEPPPDAGAERDSGHVLDGALLRRLVGPLEFPTFRSGYDAMRR